MSHHTRRGFTLVELLVVITIIAMLTALLLPAINRAREAARRATCLNNSKELGSAVLQYTLNKQKFPGWANPWPGNPGAYVGWTPMIFPYIQRNDLYQQMTNTPYTLPSNLRIEILVCPSDSVSIEPSALSYVVNSGRKDGPANPSDYPANGVFLNLAPGAGFPSGTDVAYISRHDGTSNTIMLSENIDAATWADVPEVNQSILWYPTDPAANWQPSSGSAPAPLNKYAGLMAVPNDWTARPSSSHPGGFHLTMCDGRVVFCSEEVDYMAYALRMTPDGAHAMEPPQTAGATPQQTSYPARWTTTNTVGGPLIPLSDADLNK